MTSEYFIVHYNPEDSQQTSTLLKAFTEAGIVAKCLEAGTCGVANCQLETATQVRILQAKGFEPKYGHCGMIC